MRRWLFLLCFLLAALRVDAQVARIPGPGGSLPSAGSGTLTLVQAPGSCGGGANCSCTLGSTTTTCSMTVGTAPASGNLDVFACHAFSIANNGQNPISSVSLGGSLKFPAAQFGGDGSAESPGMAYILPSTATGGTTTVVVTFTGTAVAQSGCTFAEWHPSANPNNVNLDLDMALGYASTSAPANLNGTFSGTSPVMAETYSSINGFGTATAVTSPYNTLSFFGNSFGHSYATNPANGNGPTWTLGSSVGLVAFGLGFSYNPTACLEQGMVTGSGGSNGTHVAAAGLNASMHGGAQNGTWAVTTSGSNQLFYSTTGSMPLSNPTGRMCNGENFTDNSTLGFAVTGDGVGADTDIATFTWLTLSSGSGPAYSLSFNYSSDLAQSDGSNIDCAALVSGTSTTAVVNCYGLAGQRVLGLETNSTCDGGTEQFFNAATNTQYNIQVLVTPNTSAIMKIFSSTGTLLATHTYTNAACGTAPITKVSFGKTNASGLTNGGHIYLDSFKWDFNGTFPQTD